MFPSLQQSRKTSHDQTPQIGKSEPKNPNPLGLTGTNSEPKSPPPSPKSQQHIGQMVPSQPVELQKDEKQVPKRIQLVQLQVNVEKTDIKNDTQNLKAKVDMVFEAFGKMHDENMVDNRKGTVPVYTLPEFFWSDIKSNLTPTQQETLIQDIQEKAQDPKFEGAVFVLGTMVTAYEPKSLQAIKQSDIQQIQTALGDLSNLKNQDGLDFSAALSDARGPSVENCSGDRQEARALLSTIGDMLNDRLTRAQIPLDTPPEQMSQMGFDRDQAMKEILSSVKFMAENRNALANLALLSGGKIPDPQTMQKIVGLVNDKKTAAAKKLLQKVFGPGFPQQALTSNRVEGMSAVFAKLSCDKSKVTGMLNDFRKCYYPKSADNGERGRFNTRATAMYKKGKAKQPKLGNPSSMYKQTENKAMVVEGGPNGKVDFVHKLMPSHMDQPSYFAHRDDENLIPQKLQSKRILANPKTDDAELKKRVTHFGVTPDDFKFESPKTGIKLGIAICRDYSDGVYRDYADPGLKDEVDHLQIVAAGVTKLKDHHGHFKTSVGLNDGMGTTSQFSTESAYGHKAGPDMRTDVVTYDPKTDKFTFLTQADGFESKGMRLDDESFAMGLTRPTHFKDAPRSSVSSFNSDTNQGSVSLMKQLVKDHQTSVSLWQDQLGEVSGLLEAMRPLATEKGLLEALIENDNHERDQFNKQNQGSGLVYQPKVDHEALKQKIQGYHEKLKPWIDQVNQDPLLVPYSQSHEPQYFGDQDGSAVVTMLTQKEAKLQSEISSSSKIIRANQESLDRLTVDRLRAEQLNFV